MNGFPTTNNGFRQESQASGIGVPSYRRIGVTNPSHKKYNHKESGLQNPPTKKNPSYKRYTHSVFSNPPNLPCQRVEDFKRKCVSPHSHFLNQVVLLGSDMRIHRAFEYA